MRTRSYAGRFAGPLLWTFSHLQEGPWRSITSTGVHARSSGFLLFIDNSHRNTRDNSIQNLDYSTKFQQNMNNDAAAALNHRFRVAWLDWVRQGRQMPAPLPAPANYF
jgi:hypothetical protein